MMLSMARISFGEYLRLWRHQRHLSQQALADDAETSARHLSFLETGRASPSRDMALRLLARLDVPWRERNLALQAAGYAPLFSRRAIDSPEMLPARRLLDTMLHALMPNPTVVVDRHYDVIAANAASGILLQGVDPALLRPALNVVRVSLHPGGLSRRIANFAQWRGHILERLARQFRSTGDHALKDLLSEVAAYPVPASADIEADDSDGSDAFLPLRLQVPEGLLSFISTVTVFGTPHDVTLQELAVESFFPADEFTGSTLRQWTRQHCTTAPRQG